MVLGNEGFLHGESWRKLLLPRLSLRSFFIIIHYIFFFIFISISRFLLSKTDCRFFLLSSLKD